jgi:hypothetical protein
MDSRVRLFPHDLALESSPPAAPGHNGGPPLTPPHGGWAGLCWRKAHAAAWRIPPIEVVRRRCRRAAGLGLSYRQYTSVILDRGVTVQAIVVTPGAVLSGDGMTVKPAAAAKLAALSFGRLFLLAEDQALADRLAAACGAEAVSAPSAVLAPVLIATLVGHGLTPSMAVFVGAGGADSDVARAVNPGLVLAAADYFS